MWWNVWEVIRELESRVHALERENRELKKAVADTRQPLRVRKMVYQVQTLNIHELKGTLNIGVTAPLDQAEMEKMVLEMKREED